MSELASGIASTANATPSPAPSTESSAPAISAPATPASPTPAFNSLSDAFKHMKVDEAPAEDAAPVEPIGDQPAPATVEPPKDQQVAEPGEPPKERWADILESQRQKSETKGREAALAEITQQLAPIKAVLPVANAIAQDVQTGTLDGLNQLLSEYAQHPQLGPQLRSMFGRALAQMRGQQPSQQPEAMAEPEPDLQLQDGTTVYSAAQLAKREAWMRAQLKQEIGKEFAPIRELQQRYEQAQRMERGTQEYVQRVGPLAEELQAMPGFSEHRSEIAEKQAALWKQSPQADPIQLWFRAYREVVPAKLQAKQTEQLTASALAASAGRSANPAAVTPNPPSSPRSLAEAFAQQGLR